MSKFLLQSFFQGIRLLLIVGWIIVPGFAHAQGDDAQTGKVVFEVLASEIALQRGEAGLAYNTYMEMARQYLEPRLAHRAMENCITGG